MLFATDTTQTTPVDQTDTERVAAAVAALGPLDREALLLRVRGRSIAEIATTTGTTAAMVRVRLHRAAHGVETRVGQFPTDGQPVPHDERPTDEVVTDAEVGITPMLHDRLVAALDHGRNAQRLRHRRRARLVQAALDHGPQLASLGTVAGLAAMTAAALATSA